MSNIEKGFIPLSKVEENRQDDDPVHLNLELPGFVDKEKIGINLHNIESLSRLGGMLHLDVFGEFGNPTSKEVPNISHIGPDGSAIASKSTTKEIVPVQHGDGWFSRTGPSNLRWGQMILHLHLDEISQRISDSGGNVNSATEWSKSLDKVLKSGVAHAGFRNLLTNFHPVDLLASSYGTGTLVLNHDTVAFFVFTFGFSFVDSLLARHRGFESIDSFFPGPKIDRAIAVKINEARTTLVKDLHTDKNP